jgi:hypothetical protein
VTKQIGDDDVLVTKVELDHGVSAGIRLQALSREMVPPYEEHLARLERGITMQAWYEMHPIERALIVAIRRVNIMEKNLQTEAEIEKSENDRKK